MESNVPAHQLVARDLMHDGCARITEVTTVRDAARAMRQHDVGALPVVRHDRLVGMVTDRDLVLRCLATGGDPDSLTAADVLTTPIHFTRERAPVTDVVREMRRGRVRRLPVLGEDRLLTGMVSLSDISHHVAPDVSGALLDELTAR